MGSHLPGPKSKTAVETPAGVRRLEVCCTSWEYLPSQLGEAPMRPRTTNSDGGSSASLLAAKVGGSPVGAGLRFEKR
jgi:hypothetical protein